MADNGVREAVYADIELTVLCKLKYSNFMWQNVFESEDGERTGTRKKIKLKPNNNISEKVFTFLSEFTFILNSCQRGWSHLISSQP